MAETPTARRPALSTIGRPIHFVTGQFAGHTVRTELIEVQKADLGRKYARVDRRPLDPPPAVLLRLYFVFNEGTDHETEREVDNYDEIQNLGICCNVDLFPVPSTETTETGRKGEPWKPEPSAPQYDLYPQSQSSRPAESSLVYPGLNPNIYPVGRPHASSSGASAYAGGPSSWPGPSSSAHPPPSVHGYSHSQSAQPAIPGYLPPSPADPDVVARIGKFPILEHSKCTSALVGATFVQPANVDYRGKKSLMFVFADLAVKTEGTFILRYRAFDIFSKCAGTQDLAVQAECYGGPFRVYSTKEFPGLHASTDLTKQLARWGVRLNIRETERKRRKKDDRRSMSPARSPASRKGKGKRPRDHDSNHGYRSDD
ncbi:hypothetical protein PLICRDRAFT_38618 [Plicaturopsis crispa FD-325 SS-3]|nr:hypothetical protein PLICRDRAFT_38618 [Plicaturopsis crispa FD-325 SS-3]